MYIPIEVVVLFSITVFLIIVIRVGVAEKEPVIHPPELTGLTPTEISNKFLAAAAINAELWAKINIPILATEALLEAKKKARTGEKDLYIGDILGRAYYSEGSFYRDYRSKLRDELRSRGFTFRDTGPFIYWN